MRHWHTLKQFQLIGLIGLKLSGIIHFQELTELRHTHSKVRKSLGERVTELEHTKRRADQYETEVKKLRGRVEELKRDLATAEDEVCIGDF